MGCVEQLFTGLTVEHTQQWYDNAWEAAKFGTVGNKAVNVAPRSDVESQDPQHAFVPRRSSAQLANLPPPPVYIVLDTPQNIHAWTKLRDFMKKRRLVQAKQMEAVAGGLIGSEFIFVLATIAAVVCDVTNILNGLLSSIQVS